MHVLFLCDNFPPEVNAPASRTFEHAREWVRSGARVTVITCAPNFPGGKVFPGYANRLFSREVMDGVEVVRVWSYVTANEGFLKRTLDYISYMVTATIASLFVSKPDVVVATSPQFFAACAGRMVGLLRRRPFVFELRDLWPESIRAVGAVKNQRVITALEKVEMYLYRRAAAVVCVTHAFKRHLIQRGIAPEKLFVVRNGADLTRFAPREKDEALVQSMGLQDRFVAGYVGTHGLAHGLSTVLDAAHILQAGEKTAHVRILLLGDGAEKKALQAKAKALDLNNIFFVDSVSKDDVVRYWSVLDASIIHLKSDVLFHSVIPSKLFECMAMGLPVLHGVQGESADIVEQEGVGLVFASEDAEALAAGVATLAHDDALRRRFAAQGRLASGNYDRKAMAADMLKVLETVAQKASV